MAHGRVVANLGEGLYTITVLADLTLCQQGIAQTDLTVADLEASRSDLDADRTAIESELSAATDTVNILIAEAAAVEDIRKAMAEAQNLSAQTTELNGKIATITLKIASLLTERNKLKEIVDTYEEPVNAWCADYSDELSGVVDIIEINGSSNDILIAPSSRETNSSLPDGNILPFAAMDVAGAMYNWCLLPGWKKWRPRYRLGTIVRFDASVDPTEIEVSLDRAVDTNGRSINQTCTNVGFDYMTCDQDAFCTGDRVVIEFPDNNWDRALIVGFADHPRPCAWKEHVFVQIGGTVGAWCPETETIILSPTTTASAAWEQWSGRVRENVTVMLADGAAFYGYDLPVQDRDKVNENYESCVTHDRCGLAQSCWSSVHHDLTLPLYESLDTEEKHHFVYEYDVIAGQDLLALRPGDYAPTMERSFSQPMANGSSVCFNRSFDGEELYHFYQLGHWELGVWVNDSGFRDFDFDVTMVTNVWGHTHTMTQTADWHWTMTEGNKTTIDNLRSLDMGSYTNSAYIAGESVAAQFILYEYAHYTYDVMNDTSAWGDIDIFVAATSDIVAEGEEVTALDFGELNHHAGFAAFIKEMWQAERARMGKENNEFVGVDEITTRTASVVRYIPSPGETYPPGY